MGIVRKVKLDVGPRFLDHLGKVSGRVWWR